MRSERELVTSLAITKSVAVTDADATSIVKQYLPPEIRDPRVCFSQGEGHLSGKIDAVGTTISFYLSGGIDLSGSAPKVTNLKTQLGGVPNLGAIQSQVEKTITDTINQSLSEVTLSKKYSASFGSGTVTIKEVSP